MPILRLKIGVEGEGIQWSKIKIQSDTVAKWQRCHWLRYEMPFNLFRLAEASFGVLPDLPNFKGMGHGFCRWLLDLASLKVECQTCKSNRGETKAAPKRVKGRLVWSTQVVGLSLSFLWQTTAVHYTIGSVDFVDGTQVGQRAKKPIERWSWAFFASETSRFFGKKLSSL